MVLMHVKLFELSFCFTLRVESAKVVLEFHDEEVEVCKPCRVAEVQEGRFETIQCHSLQIQKGIVVLGFSILKKVLLVPKFSLH